jgi:hypothetical protein
MHRRIISAIATWPLLTAAGFAQSASPAAPVDMAQVEIGKPFPFPAIDPNADETMAAQLGWYTFDSPNAPQSSFPFAQYQVGINNRTRAVYYVRGTKPYSSVPECFRGLQSVATAMRTRHGIPKKTLMQPYRDSWFEEVASDLSIEGRCGNRGSSPYVELTVTIMSVSQKNELEAIRKKTYAR